ncbi:MAG: DEAD/DEAH box helicase [Nitrososphaerota archaeon]|nr:DEAD/DEAH box helicase [Candidatus Bathyarchaeota archaeon]MDW8049356.1 DEAD/DEAH box helicase [Nitrososphaerota archaeon]
MAIPDQVQRLLIDSGIVELFPPQEEAVNAGALEGKNILLASPTASGKTLVAELCALKHILEKDGKVLYLTPLRALANEKYEEFRKYEVIRKPNGRRVRVGISTGDFDSSDPWLEKFDIIVTTNEKCDSLLRHRAHWIDNISLLVADEVHLLNDGERGPTLEVVLARLLQIKPDIQVLALSATVRNAEEIAEWLRAIPIMTQWRPVTLREGVLINDEIQFSDGDSLKIKRRISNPVINLALHGVEGGGQTLIFADSRKSAVSLATKIAGHMKGLISKPLQRSLDNISKKISASGERTRISRTLADLVRNGVAFHHAGLGSEHRKIVEDYFRDGKIKVLTATPTLAFGVNLPARMVIISSYRRYEPGYGYYPITVLEYKQMAGRAGRPKYDKIGESILLAKTEEELDYLFSNYVLAKPERIWSKLGVEKVLRAHVLSTIASEFAFTENGVFEFFGRTLYAHQYDLRAMRGVISKILKFLYQEGMIEAEGPSLRATQFGRRVSQLYIDPLSAIIIRDGLRNIPAKITDMTFLHLVSHTPDMFPKFRCTGRDFDQVSMYVETNCDEFMFEPPAEWDDRLAYEEFLGEVKTALILKSWIEEMSEDEMIEKFGVEPGDLYRLVSTAEWLLYASHELASLLGYKDFLAYLSSLRERVVKGVKRELLPLARLEGVGRVRARILYDAGFKSIEDLKRADLEELMRLPMIGKSTAKKIKEQIGGYVRKEDWRKISSRNEGEQKALMEYY